jgi:hypothetical protein
MARLRPDMLAPRMAMWIGLARGVEDGILFENGDGLDIEIGADVVGSTAEIVLIQEFAELPVR